MRVAILTMNVDVISESQAVDLIYNWAIEHKNKYVCVSNVHMCMEVLDNIGYAKVINSSDLTIADGKPIYWAQKLLGYKNAKQVRGEDLTMAICGNAEKMNYSIGFFGATNDLLGNLKKRINNLYPNLEVVFKYAPPFHSVTDDENREIIEAINNSGVNILFVGLGCPKQEIWMAEHKDQLNCVMLGVGAAFDFIAGNKKNAPDWMQSIGLEWLFRLLSEPRRLWKRYVKQNPRFIYYFTLQLLGKKF